MAARVVCPAVATKARIMQMSRERYENRIDPAICNLVTSSGEIFAHCTFNVPYLKNVLLETFIFNSMNKESILLINIPEHTF